MLDFQKELLSRLHVAAAIAKADGFEATAAAILVVAEGLNNEIVTRPLGGNSKAFSILRAKPLGQYPTSIVEITTC